MNGQWRPADLSHVVVGVGSATWVQRRVQSGGSMADDAIVLEIY
jgi:hypothetical protein